jgi:serine/threonine-protein kinase
VAESFMTMLTKHLMEEPVPPSARRPDLVITPEMDALVLKSLEKDREKRWQSMAELVEAVGVCPGPDTAAARPPGGQTVEMGGAHAAAALKILRAKGTRTETSRVSSRSVDSALSSADAGAAPATASRGKTLVLAIVGVVLGGAVAAWLALSHGKPQPPMPPPAAIAPPSPVAPTPPPAPPVQPAAAPAEPPVAPAAAVEEPTAEQPDKHGAHGHKAKPAMAGHAKPAMGSPETAPTPAPKPTTPATPGELKPFPKL